jgi:hypothetical protein
MITYLGLSSALNDQVQTTATGSGIFDGLGPYALSFPYTNLSDIVNATDDAESAFDGNLGGLGIANSSGSFLSSFWSFGLEALPEASDRADVLSAFLQACDTLPQQDGDKDGTPNGEDCAPNDSNNWSVPGPATNLTIKRFSPVGPNVFWSPPIEPGGTAVSYDLLRGDTAADFGTAVCSLIGSSDTSTSDAAVPTAGQVIYYLVRVRNGCGETIGIDSAGEPRPPGVECH